MTNEELYQKMEEIHRDVVALKTSQRGDRAMCEQKHEYIDERISALHKVVKGNGKKGLEDKHDELRSDFTSFKFYVVGYAAGGSMIGGAIFALAATFFK